MYRRQQDRLPGNSAESVSHNCGWMENLLPKAIPLNYHESSRISEKSNVLNPVRLGQFAQLPASGTRDSSSFENRTDLRLR